MLTDALNELTSTLAKLKDQYEAKLKQRVSELFRDAYFRAISALLDQSKLIDFLHVFLQDEEIKRLTNELKYKVWHFMLSALLLLVQSTNLSISVCQIESEIKKNICKHSKTNSPTYLSDIQSYYFS